jgi:hypothetical protein
MTKQQTKARHECAEVPEFERLNYFFGQMLSAADFRTEQSYFREKLKLHNRCLHGYGVVCGLEVTPVPEEECCPPADKKENDKTRKRLAKIEAEIAAIQEQLADPTLTGEKRDELQKALETASGRREELRRNLEQRQPYAPDGSESCGDEDKPRAPVLVHCGLALDCHGNELVLRQPVLVDLWAALAPSEQRRLRDEGKGILYLSICYCGEPTHPSRPVLPDTCGAVSDCNFGKTRDSVRFRVGFDRPDDDARCEPCCAPCTDECVLLAAIKWEQGDPIDEDDIDNSARRGVSLYEPTVITGISWRHGEVYSPSQGRAVLGTESDGGRTDGLEVTFSRPVHAETLQAGVIDIWRIQGGRGIRGPISSIEGDYVNKPNSGLISSFRYRDESGETLNRGDRILVIIRSDFILDACCRPVDGNHIGGRVPQIEAYKAPPPQAEAVQDKDYNPDQPGGDGDHGCGGNGGGHGPCRLPPGGIGPWTSGNGSAGGTFESWFYID